MAAPLAELTGLRAVVPKLLNFLKEYHMQSSAPESGQRVQQLLRDVAQGRKRDGALGAVTLSEEAVEEAIAAFEDWMRECRPGMPCSYWSNQHKVYIKGFVGEMEGEYLNVRASPQKAADLRVMGEATNVFPREDSGWYVPPLPEAAAKSEAVPVKQTLHRVKADFDGRQYGDEYLILQESCLTPAYPQHGNGLGDAIRDWCVGADLVLVLRYAKVEVVAAKNGVPYAFVMVAAGPADPISGLKAYFPGISGVNIAEAITLVVNNVIQKQSWPIPEAISTILVGIGLGAVAAAFPEVNRSTFQKLEDMSARQFMLVFIAPIIFAEGYGMKSQQFFDNITRILLHAFLGTLISALVVAVAIFYLVPLTGALKLELAECLAFGAMISSTDPVTTLAIFKEQSLAEKGRGHLYYSVLGESILNDAVAIALFGSFADLVRSGEVIDAAVSARIFLNFLKVFVASTLIGVAGGLATAFLLKSARLGAGSSEGEHFYFNIPEIGVALVLAYVPFLAAEACDLSGIVAIMFAGITMRHYAHFNLTQVTRQIFLPTVELIASLCETYVFILLGLGVFLLQGAFSASLVIWSALACLLGRLVHVYPLSFLANRISTGPKMSVKAFHRPGGDGGALQVLTA
ncbi:SLC9A8 [Symbiodinium microadriaticum]|nr:SLC9A8 [Symbiodinium microadriaticum]